MHRKNGDLVSAVDVYSRYPLKKFDQNTFEENSKKSWITLKNKRPKSSKK